jgi:hypothetical protein
MKSLMLLVDRNKEHFLFQQEVDPAVLQASWFTSSSSNSSSSGGGGGATSSFLYSQPTGPGGSLVRQKSVTTEKTLYSAGRYRVDNNDHDVDTNDDDSVNNDGVDDGNDNNNDDDDDDDDGDDDDCGVDICNNGDCV